MGVGVVTQGERSKRRQRAAEEEGRQCGRACVAARGALPAADFWWGRRGACARSFMRAGRHILLGTVFCASLSVSGCWTSDSSGGSTHRSRSVSAWQRSGSRTRGVGNMAFVSQQVCDSDLFSFTSSPLHTMMHIKHDATVSMLLFSRQRHTR